MQHETGHSPVMVEHREIGVKRTQPHCLVGSPDMKVDFAAVDAGTQVVRRLQKLPPRQGGWQMFISGYYGIDLPDPTNKLLRANGNESTNGWANNPQIEAEI